VVTYLGRGCPREVCGGFVDVADRGLVRNSSRCCDDWVVTSRFGGTDSGWGTTS
jgi:hypothetical protein